jgi:nucleotide-binding universal stress UspA family protein
MFTNTLIGIDGRDGGRDAIELARLLAAPGAELTLAHVRAPLRGRGVPEPIGIERAQDDRLLEQACELAGVDANACVSVAGSVGGALHDLAEDRGADLLVVGATRHNVLGRVMFGDHSRAALDEAPCPIAIAPLGYSRVPHQLRRIGVGYNGSAESHWALTAARELVDLAEGEITALWVISREDVREEKPIPADWPSATDDLMGRHADQLAQLDGVGGLVACGGPREALAELGTDVDLLIVGSGDHGRIDRVVRGTVSRYLARHATCPLLVVPRETAAGAPSSGAQRAHQVAIGG